VLGPPPGSEEPGGGKKGMDYSLIFSQLDSERDDFELIDFQYHPAKQRKLKKQRSIKDYFYYKGSEGQVFEWAFGDALEGLGIEFIPEIEYVAKIPIWLELLKKEE
jgi:hypothetical protein